MAVPARRLGMAGHPVVVGSLVVLAANDRVLKGWSVDHGVLARTLTGKASDLAGVLLLAVMAGLATRRRRPAVIGVGLAFILLKLSPAVADLAVPLLGGRTRTDPWDLLALAALLPADRLLRRLDDDQPAPHPRPAQVPLRATLGLAVLLLSVPAMTATSPCPDPPTVVLLAADDDGLIAAVGDRDSVIQARRDVQERTPGTDIDQWALEWFRSTDGGRRWTPASPRADQAQAAVALDPAEEACLRDACYRVAPEEVRERVGDGPWRRSFAHTGTVPEAMPTLMSCPTDEDLTFGPIAVDEGAVVVANGTQGVIRRAGTGGWERLPLGRTEPDDVHRQPPFDVVAGVALGLILFGTWLSFLTLSPRPPRRAVGAGAICWGGAFTLGLLAAVGSSNAMVGSALRAPVVVLLGFGIAAAGWTVAARSRPPLPVRPAGSGVGPPGTRAAARRDDPPAPRTD